MMVMVVVEWAGCWHRSAVWECIDMMEKLKTKINKRIYIAIFPIEYTRNLCMRITTLGVFFLTGSFIHFSYSQHGRCIEYIHKRFKRFLYIHLNVLCCCCSIITIMLLLSALIWARRLHFLSGFISNNEWERSVADPFWAPNMYPPICNSGPK